VQRLKMFRSRSGVGVYSAKTGAESESKILDSVSVHHCYPTEMSIALELDWSGS